MFTTIEIGSFPELEAATESRLRQLNPDSVMLRVAKPVMRLSDLEREEATTLKASLDQWTKDMGTQHASLLKTRQRDDIPQQQPVRNTNAKIAFKSTQPKTQTQNISKVVQTPKPARIPGHDFAAWDRFDADAAMQDTDENADEPAPAPKADVQQVAAKSIPKQLPATTVHNIPKNALERERMAAAEKDKGNECYRAGDLEESVVYYSRSISILETAASLNNRALSFLRLKRYGDAEADCSRVLGLEANNTKALIRRATARRSLKNYSGARADIDVVLKKDPSNKDALVVLKGMPEASAAPVPQAQPVSVPIASSEPKKRRIVIEEISDDEDEPEVSSISKTKVEAQGTNADTPVVAPVEHTITTAFNEDNIKSSTSQDNLVSHQGGAPQAQAKKPPPPKVDELRERGNKCFAIGDYAEAKNLYSQALTQLEKELDAADHVLLQSNLLSNRAACCLKIGDSSTALADCNLSLQIDVGNVKSLLRRASAFEMKERYEFALDDYRAVLRAHPAHASALDGVNRASRALRAFGSIAGKTTSTVAPTTPPPPPAPAATVSSKDQYELWKTRGNSYVQQGEFQKAVECYNECVQVDASLAFAYNNRAHCYLKLGKPSEAVQDATSVLAIEPTNIKALYRRAQGYIALKAWSRAKESLDQVLAIDPGNAPAKKDLATVSPMVVAAPQLPKAAPAQNRVRIEEIDEIDSLSSVPTKLPFAASTHTTTTTNPLTPASVPKAASKPAAASSIKSSTVPDRAPTTPLEFIRLFSSLKANDAGFASVLLLIAPSDLPRLFSNQLEADHLSILARIFSKTNLRDSPQVIDYLTSLTQVARFDMTKGFLTSDDIDNFAQLFALLQTRGLDSLKIAELERKFLH